MYSRHLLHRTSLQTRRSFGHRFRRRSNRAPLSLRNTIGITPFETRNHVDRRHTNRQLADDLDVWSVGLMAYSSSFIQILAPPIQDFGG